MTADILVELVAKFGLPTAGVVALGWGVKTLVAQMRQDFMMVLQEQRSDFKAVINKLEALDEYQRTVLQGLAETSAVVIQQNTDAIKKCRANSDTKT